MSQPSTAESDLPEGTATPAPPQDSAPAESVASPPPRSTRPVWWWWLAVLMTLAAAVLPAIAWPDQVSWLIDEPQLIARAYHANQAGKLAERGLVGNFGLIYGPTATQIYQLMLGVTHDPLTLARLRAGLCAGVTALGLLWLARSLRLNPWFATAVVLAPYLWVFQRIIWDASFAIPVGTVAVAAYAAFLRHGGVGTLLLALFCAAMMPFIHPQNLPLAAPILLHVLWRHHQDLWRNVGGVLLVIAAVLLLNFMYFMHLSVQLSYYLKVGFPKTYPGYHSWVAAYFGPIGLDEPAERALALLGMEPPPSPAGRHILGGHGFVGEGDGGFGPLVEYGKRGLYVIYPLLWGGIAIAAWRVLRGGRRTDPARDHGQSAVNPELAPEQAPAPRGASAENAKRSMGGIALAGVILQVLIAGQTRVPAEPQYFFGTFALHALLAWLAVDALARIRLSYVAVLAYGLSGAAVTLGIMWHYHRPGPPAVPNPASDMPTLGDSVAVVEALRPYPADVHAFTEIDLYQRFPQTLRALRLLLPPATDPAATRPAGPLVIRFRSPSHHGGTPRIEVVEASSAAEIPNEARRINVSPLPAGWRPGMD